MLKTHLLVVVGRERGGVEDKGGEGLKEDVCCNHCLGMDGGCVD
jgi:hypothetical protein